MYCKNLILSNYRPAIFPQCVKVYCGAGPGHIQYKNTVMVHNHGICKLHYFPHKSNRYPKTDRKHMPHQEYYLLL